MNVKDSTTLKIIFSRSFLISFFTPLLICGIFFTSQWPLSYYEELVRLFSYLAKTYIGTRGQISQIDHGLNKIGGLLIIFAIVTPLILLVCKWVLQKTDNNLDIVIKESLSIQLGQKDWLIMGSLLLFGCILRGIPINQSLWQPEITSFLVFMKGGLASTLLPTSAAGPQPLMQLIGIIFSKVFGVSDLALRFPSYLISVMSIPLLYWISIKMTGDRVFSLITGSIFLINSFHVFLSFQMRSYGMMAFFTILSTYFLGKLLQNPSKSTAHKLIASNVLLGYSHLYGILFILTQVIAVFLIRFVQVLKKRPKYFIIKEAGLRFFQSFIVTFLILGFLYLAYIPVTAMSLFNTEYTQALPYFEYLKRAISLSYHIVSFVDSTLLSYGTLVLLLSVIIIFYFIINSIQELLIFILFIGTLVFSLVLPSGQGFYPRYLVCCIPLFALCLSYLICRWWRSGKILKKISSVFLALSYIIISLFGFKNANLPIYPIKEALNYVKNHHHYKGDLICGDWFSYTYLAYYDEVVERFDNIEELEDLIALERNMIVIINTTSKQIDRNAEGNKFLAIEKIENSFKLIKTFDGHFPIRIWVRP